MAAKGEGEYCAGEWCQFCRATVKCRARAAEKLRIAEEEFKRPPLLTDSEIEALLPILPDITKWAEDISAYALEAAVNHDKEWNADETAVAAAAKEHGYTDIYRQSLITLTDMEKLMGKKQFGEILGGLVIKPPGKPTLVPLSDKRQAMNVSNAKNEFNEIMED